MLTLLNRYGPDRQRLLKGYTLAGTQPQRLLAAVTETFRKNAPRIGGNLVQLVTHRRNARLVWVDTGWILLASAAGRQAVFQELSAVVALAANAVAKAEGNLLPGGASPTATSDWRPWICGDRHLLRTADQTEKERFCNLLRYHLAELIAFSGKAGVSPLKVEDIGSRRLSVSPRHAVARWFTSASEAYLARAARELRRRAGIPSLNALDIVPRVENEGQKARDFVEIRFVDAQACLPVVRAQTIVFQALRVRASRLAERDQPAPDETQSLIERNRARAIAQGPRAWLEQPPVPWQASANDNLLRARDVFLLLMEDLRPELQSLEAEYDELAPLLLGAALRQQGFPAVENENDLFRLQLRSRPSRDATLPASLSSPSAISSPQDELSAWNEKRFDRPARYIRAWWEELLRPTGTPRRATHDHCSEPIERLADAAEDRQRRGGLLILLHQFARETGTQDLRKAWRHLPPERARRVRGLFNLPEAQTFYLDDSEEGWKHPAARQAQSCARQRDAAMLILEFPAKRQHDGDIQALRLHRQCPGDLELFCLEQFCHGPSARQGEQGHRSSAVWRLLLIQQRKTR